MAILTEEMILAKTRCKDLERVRLMFAVAPTVFLGVTKLVFVSSRFQKPQHVRQRSRGREHLEGENTQCALLRRGPCLTFGFFAQRMHCLEVLSLTANKISSLHFFSQCTKLQELYLRRNAVRQSACIDSFKSFAPRSQAE